MFSHILTIGTGLMLIIVIFNIYIFNFHSNLNINILKSHFILSFLSFILGTPSDRCDAPWRIFFELKNCLTATNYGNTALVMEAEHCLKIYQSVCTKVLW